MKKPKINTHNENIVLIHKRQLFVAFELLKLERITKTYEKSDLHLSVNVGMCVCLALNCHRRQYNVMTTKRWNSLMKLIHVKQLKKRVRYVEEGILLKTYECFGSPNSAQYTGSLVYIFWWNWWTSISRKCFWK